MKGELEMREEERRKTDRQISGRLVCLCWMMERDGAALRKGGYIERGVGRKLNENKGGLVIGV